jgi:hypothetical protein
MLISGGVLLYQNNQSPEQLARLEVFSKIFISKIKNNFKDIAKILGVNVSEIILVLFLKIALLTLSIYFIKNLFELSRVQHFCFYAVGLGILIRKELFRKIKTIDKYQRAVESEFSSFAETLALSTNSGLSFTAAFVRSIKEFVGPSINTSEIENQKVFIRNYFFPYSKLAPTMSPLKRELIYILSEINAMKTIPEILDNFSARIKSQVISDFADAIVLSLTRGTPIAQVISEHAKSIREKNHREMLERAGKAEIKMMIPIVFLLLPISVLFALWPSFQQLQQMVVLS